jgi:hypothetical protein
MEMNNQQCISIRGVAGKWGYTAPAQYTQTVLKNGKKVWSLERSYDKFRSKEKAEREGREIALHLGIPFLADVCHGKSVI